MVCCSADDKMQDIIKNSILLFSSNKITEVLVSLTDE